tara:strand:- start:398 stop:613 length:216 start_codon:yes stop_codon:yes gene_type:complete
MKENSLEYFMQIVLDPNAKEWDKTLALQELRTLLPYEEENDYEEDPFDRDGWDDEAAYLSAGSGMDESYEW